MKKSRNISQVEQTPGVIAPELPATPEPLVRPEPDRSRTPRPVKRYRYRFSPVIFGALLLGLALCLGGFGLTTWFFADFLSGGNLSNVFEWLQYGLLYLASVGIGLFIVAVLLRSEYVLTDRTLIVRLGFLRSRTPLKISSPFTCSAGQTSSSCTLTASGPTIWSSSSRRASTTTSSTN